MSSICVIIPTLNRDGELLYTLEEIREVALHVIAQIIIIIDGPPSVEVADSDILEIAWCPTIVLRQPRRVGASRCRNLAWPHVTEEYVAFLDDDTHPLPCWPRAVLDALEEGVSVLTGPITAQDKTLLSQAREIRYRRRYRDLRNGERVAFLAGGNSVIRAAVLARYKEFTTDGISTEQSLGQLLSRTQDAARFAADMKVRHRHDRGWLAAIWNAWRAGVAKHRRAFWSRPAMEGASPVPSLVNLMLWIVFVLGGIAGVIKILQGFRLVRSR